MVSICSNNIKKTEIFPTGLGFTMDCLFHLAGTVQKMLNDGEDYTD